jgi:hypothetical protein
MPSFTISDVTSSIGAIAAASGAIAVWRGVNAWRTKLIGSNEYRLAKQLLILLRKTLNAYENLLRTNVDLDKLLTYNLKDIEKRFDRLCLEGWAHWGDSFYNLREPLVRFRSAHPDAVKQAHLGDESWFDNTDDRLAELRNAVSGFEKYLKTYMKR